MTRIIDSSYPGAQLLFSQSWGGDLIIKFAKGFATPGDYTQKDIKNIAEIDEEKYRSAGKAVAGAIIAGALTGGIGLLVGAAFGGRRRKTGTYMIVFNDDSYVVFEEKKGSIVRALDRLIEKNVARETVEKFKAVSNRTDQGDLEGR